MVDDCRVFADLPQPAIRGKRADQIRFGVSEAKKIDGQPAFPGRLTVDDPRFCVGKQPFSLCSGGGASVGLGGEVRQPVDDGDELDAAGAREFAGLLQPRRGGGTG
jgi:hypothetical protein